MAKYFVLAAILFLLLCVNPVQGQQRTLLHAGLSRSYLLHVPPSYDGNPPVPLGIALHEFSGSAASFQTITAFSAKANAEGFIVVYPNGISGSWTGGGCCGAAMTNNLDDAGFINALIDTLAGQYHIDLTRIFVAGFSNGAILAYRLAAELSHKIAAISAVAGPMMLDKVNPSRPVPIMHFHALNDAVIPYNGGNASGFVFPSVMSVLDFWINRNQCDPNSTIIYNRNGVIGRKWQALANNADIILYTTPMGGHNWPSSIAATDTIWSFFTSHTMPPVTAVDEKKSEIIAETFVLQQNYPNPFNPTTTIRFTLAQPGFVTLKIYNLQGQEVAALLNERKSAGEHNVSWAAGAWPSGLYFSHLQSGARTSKIKLILNK
ncbi:MAG: T9SS type A sorting domain-containing protein [bacterium]